MNKVDYRIPCGSSEGYFIVKKDIACHRIWLHEPKLLSAFGHLWEMVITARKRSLRRLCFYRCLSVHTGGGHAWFYSGGACVVLFGGHAWFYLGGHAWFYLEGHAWFYSGVGMRGFILGVCVVLFRGCVWFYLGGMHGFIRGACMVLFRGVHGCSGGACMVAWGGMCGCSQGGHAWLLWGACVVALGRGGVRGFFDEIRSMSGRYASHWNAFLFCF